MDRPRFFVDFFNIYGGVDGSCTYYQQVQINKENYLESEQIKIFGKGWLFCSQCAFNAFECSLFIIKDNQGNAGDFFVILIL